MKLLLGCLALTACASGPHKIHDVKHDVVAAASTELFDAIARKDVAAIQSFMAEPVELGGLWFFDHECVREFPGARRVELAELPALAKCLATLPIHRSSRTDPLFGVVVGNYDPGIEIELALAYRRDGERPRLRWVGFAGRRDFGDALPTVTPAALEPLRVAGETAPTLTPDTDQALHAQLAELRSKEMSVWFKICVGADGAVTSVHARETSSPLMVTSYSELIKTWQFQPFKLGDQPTPVCTLERFLYPSVASVAQGTPATDETLPWPMVSNEDANVVRVNASILKNVKVSSISTYLTESDRQILADTGVQDVEGTAGFCVNEQGAVFHAFMLEPTGLHDLDERAVRTMRTWRFRPVVIGGAVTRVCTAFRLGHHHDIQPMKTERPYDRRSSM